MAIPEWVALERYRQDMAHLTNMARNDLAGFLYQVRDLPVAEVRELLIQVMPDIVAPYLSASGALSANWYEQLRAAVGARGSFYPQTFSWGVQQSQANAVARWAVGPLAEGDTTLVLSRLAGSVQRMIFDAARGVVEGNAIRDPVRVGFQRIARPGCCAFCGMLASRGAVYRSSESAGGVVGRGSDRTGFGTAGNRLSGGIGGGAKARGQMNLGDRYHDDCNCVVMPVFVGTELAEIARIEKEKYLEMYQQSGGRGTSDVLANWRKEHGTH